MICEYTAKKYCCEDLSLIENYELAINDTTQMWDCHHRGEVLPCGRFSIDDLKKFGLYYKRPAAELIFLTPFEHRQLHKKGVPKSEATKKAMSEAHMGIPKGPMSDAHKRAIGEALSKKVLQFTKSGEFIKEWPSSMEASRQLVIAQPSICNCCNGKYKSAGGYVWKYAEDLSDILEAVFEHYRDATTADGVVF